MIEQSLQGRPLKARIEADLRDRLSPAHQALYFWGMGNIFLVLICQFMNILTGPIGVQKFAYASMGAWFIVGLATKKIPLRLPLGIIFMLLLQIWFAITTLVASVYIARATIFTAFDILLLVYFMSFLQAQGLVWLDPRCRRVFGRIMLIVMIASAFIAVAQFVGFGPAQAIGKMIRDADSLQAIADAETGDILRTPGLHSNIGMAVAYGTISIVMLCSILYFRKFKFYEVASILALIASLVVVQVRNQALAIGLTILFLGWIIAKRYKVWGVLTNILVALAAVGVIFAKRESFGYLFEGGTGTLDYRRDVLWTQAWNILNQHPVIGIGIEPGFAGWTTQILPNKWMQVGLMDNGWLIAGAFGGYPGMFLLGLVVLTGLIGSLRAAVAPAEDVWHFAFKLGTIAMMIFFTTGLFWGTVWCNPLTASLFFVLAGLSMDTNLVWGQRPTQGIVINKLVNP